MEKTVYEQLKEAADYYGKKNRLDALQDIGYSLAFACRQICFDDTETSETSDKLIPTTEDLENLIECVVEAAILIDQVMYLLGVDVSVLASLKEYKLFIDKKKIQELEMTANGQ